ncbi:hypothetical protein GCM10010315_40560 [Streptomyces luteosporeus]|uniref:Uncharacterized protein n=1 Tax=Streptomyces luteosporeus TaxID=173856 RepID=A0ABP6GBM0_9ACTN
MIYTARVLLQLSSDVHRFLAPYLDEQRALLVATADDHPQALAVISDPALRQRLGAVHAEAPTLWSRTPPGVPSAVLNGVL